MLTLPMQVKVTTWTNNRDTVSVDRGPLTYSLQIKEEYKRHGGTDKWPALESSPARPGITVWCSRRRPATFQVVQADWPADNQPFRAKRRPMRLTAKAKRIPSWILDPRGCVNEVIQQPIKSAEPEETVTLIPMGAARLRISAFPVIGSGPEAAGVAGAAAAQAVAFKASASHCFDSDTVDAVGDGLEPPNSNDHEIPRFTWWPHRGTDEWVQYDLARRRRFPRSRCTGSTTPASANAACRNPGNCCIWTARIGNRLPGRRSLASPRTASIASRSPR